MENGQWAFNNRQFSGVDYLKKALIAFNDLGF
jgi:hypothetical protein